MCWGSRVVGQRQALSGFPQLTSFMSPSVYLWCTLYGLLSWALTTYFCLNLKNSFLGYLTNNEWFLQFLRNYLINTNNWDEDERRDNWMSVFTNASASSLFPFTRRITEAKSRLDGSSGERMGAGKEEEGRRRREISRGWGWEELETVKWTVTLKSGTVGAELCKKDFQKTAICFVI